MKFGSALFVALATSSADASSLLHQRRDAGFVASGAGRSAQLLSRSSAGGRRRGQNCASLSMRFDNSDPSRVMTLTRFMLEETRKNPDMQDFESLMGSIQLACKSINNLVMKAGMTNLLGLAGEVNIQGEDQKKLDVLSNDVLKNSLSYTGRCGVVASEVSGH
uniref:fructose-bisphosphatase n=1 Tax=Chromera velia CCMP2878 TaxID=1169474 RepID=A0A0G4HBP3_9ALVE|eukprot:Cvel_25987.t1-p1 / transcript=Cvel_25987.t1 / gene=Cvel_25987 / organism=Chromera_velia_CCMP2878 / gene_product=Fructose-1,6-bisphosphatase, cytosolic, putative / transcript_product=Fructose-1,6-bisphosphatase, cytosolic, putative / location=Cvel_scaffold3020:18067-19825(+) / protein_length=162 / sequence_SO=supercontig / SO=protein_coding / is_pseudo=false